MAASSHVRRYRYPCLPALFVTLLFAFNFFILYTRHSSYLYDLIELHTPRINSKTTKPKANKSTSTSTSTSTFTSAIETPPPLADVYSLPKNANLTRLALLDCLSPRVVAAYIRPALARAAPAHDIFLFTTSLLLRKLTPSHCLIGSVQYAVTSYSDEVTHCVVPKAPTVGHRLTVVLTNDRNTERALLRARGVRGGFQALPLRVGIDVHVVVHGRDDTAHQKNTTTTRPNTAKLYSVASSLRVDRQRIDKYDAARSHTYVRYGVCLATMTRPGGHMLHDWVDYHRRIGVDHVYILDNGATPSPARTFSHRRDVEVLSWPWAKTQVQGFSFLLLALRRRCRHVFLADVDEFVMFGVQDDAHFSTTASSSSSDSGGVNSPLASLLAEAERVGKLHVQFRVLLMANSGYVSRPVGAVPMLYTHARKEQAFSFGKSVCATDVDWESARIHSCGIHKGRAPSRFSPPLGGVEHTWRPKMVSDAPLLVHFYARSWEEWVEKWNTGTAVVLQGLGRDKLIGRHSLSEPDAEYVRVEGRSSAVPFDYFRTVWLRVGKLGKGRLGRCVVVWSRPRDGGGKKAGTVLHRQVLRFEGSDDSDDDRR